MALHSAAVVLLITSGKGTQERIPDCWESGQNDGIRVSKVREMSFEEDSCHSVFYCNKNFKNVNIH